MPPLTDEQFASLVALRDAMHAAEAANPGNAILKSVHSAMAVGVLAAKPRMTDAQFHTLGGGPKDD